MAELEPRDIWKIVEEQAREDEALEAQMREVASMSDAALDEELRQAGVDVAEVEKRTRALHASSKGAPKVERRPAPRVVEKRPWRRPVVLWLVAATAAVAGGLAYSALHEAPPPAPAPAPTPSTPRAPPVQPGPPDLVAATDMRHRAAVAYDAGHLSECLSLLDQARDRDPAGDAAPEVKQLRAKVMRAFDDKPDAGR
ncbi:MAG TPA: hypothetical protein VIF15_04925 [Polyangiaceae bacterium]|jgi:hypothetical protein